MTGTETEIAAALNAQTHEVAVDISGRDCKSLLLQTGEWGALCILADPTMTPNLRADVRAAAIVARDTLLQDLAIQIHVPAVAAGVAQMLGALVQAGVISAASQAAMLALGTVTQPVWNPPLTAGDIQTAKAQ
jgi:hypothetical protein